MPPRAKTQEMIEQEKRKIIVTCLELMDGSDFEGISMRQLALVLGTSPTYIYQYFQNKDELYLYILVEGFTMQREAVEAAISKYKRPLKRLEVALNTYFEFAFKKYPFFFLMYGSNKKKCSDYVGTPSEAAAVYERDVAFQCRDLQLHLLQECIPDITPEENLVLLGHIRCCVYGLVHLYRNNMLREIGVDYKPVMKSLTEQILRTISERRKHSKKNPPCSAASATEADNLLSFPPQQ